MKSILLTVGMLIASNVFMTFAWYGHLKKLSGRPVLVAVVISWSIAFFEYLIQVPANRIGYTVLPVDKLKIIQETVSLTVFVPFMLLYFKQPFRLSYLWAGLCILGAVYFIFKQ
jgi:uncharacterized protein (DUF486 family)